MDIIVLGGQSANLAESASVGDTVISLVITEATPTNVIIAAGNGDNIFAVSSAGVITVASTANLDYETTTSYTLSIIAYNAQSSDVADVTINIVDANDAPSAGNDATGALTEDASTSTVTGTITGTDQDGDTLTYWCYNRNIRCDSPEWRHMDLHAGQLGRSTPQHWTRETPRVTPSQ